MVHPKTLSPPRLKPVQAPVTSITIEIEDDENDKGESDLEMRMIDTLDDRMPTMMRTGVSFLVDGQMTLIHSNSEMMSTSIQLHSKLSFLKKCPDIPIPFPTSWR